MNSDERRLREWLDNSSPRAPRRSYERAAKALLAVLDVKRRKGNIGSDEIDVDEMIAAACGAIFGEDKA